ncbi:SpoIID/LytB domain-containing protein [Bacillus luteolus]|uniref:SpoIID/LytB domain-containing protein n=1 Tax=Litchfieldia luteola TaxID=682179 RepID=A0ABR9QEZ8_9BACI|nr:SpoIID/LytB domain-containing protein [Cytobacillus luteolus]MBE4907071.1 SpoIID/LytB domain-containing protein [Cytobacillus luteolus]MBP1943462.1 SpoIID/LytB domain protein [Cytobacillus luteolus]
MNKLLFSVLTIALLLVLPGNSKAQNLVYPNPVTVLIFENSTGYTATLNGNYQLVNKQTGATTVLQSNPLGISKSGTNVVITNGQTVHTSANGFLIQEIIGKVAAFSQDTIVRKGATTSYEQLTVATAGTTATYNDIFINGSGETWYSVTLSNKMTGWVQSTTTSLIEANSLSLTTINGVRYRGSFDIRLKSDKIQAINVLDMEDYLKGVVPSEMPASWHMEALKAQAIAARSFAQNSMILSNTATSQVYRGFTGEHPRTNEAIAATRGLLVKYNGRPIQTFFHSTSGGRTANVGDVWNSNQANFPYLVSVEDRFENSPHSVWSHTFSALTILKSFGFSESTILYDVITEQKGANGEVGGVTVKTSEGEKTIRGNESVIRKLFPLNDTRVYNQLLSNWFSIELSKEVRSFLVQTTSNLLNIDSVKGHVVQTTSGTQTISTDNMSVQTANGTISTTGGVESVKVNGKGWGHRIGMSQYGAKGYAENGWTAEQILTHYYKGTTVSK